MEITDWNGQTIREGDTVLWTSGTGNCINYGTVTRIDQKEYAYYDGGNRKQTLTRVQVKAILTPGRREPNGLTTIIEKTHYYAYPSITKFQAQRADLIGTVDE